MVYFGHGTLVKLDFLPLGLRGDEQPAKLPVPSALAPRLATLATAVGFREGFSVGLYWQCYGLWTCPSSCERVEAP